MKLNKKIIKKKNKKNKKKQNKIIKNNVDLISEKISLALDMADLKVIKNITSILTPKVALRICNEASSVEQAGGIMDPETGCRRLNKLESFLHLIQNDSNISQNKKTQILNGQTTTCSQPSIVSKPSKKKRKQLKQKIRGIETNLDSLRLTMVKNEIKNHLNNSRTSNYFAIRSLNKLNDIHSNDGFANQSADIHQLKPSTFNLSFDNGMPSITPNYFSNSLISKPRLDLSQINFFNTNQQTACSEIVDQVKCETSFQTNQFPSSHPDSFNNHLNTGNDLANLSSLSSSSSSSKTSSQQASVANLLART